MADTTESIAAPGESPPRSVSLSTKRRQPSGSPQPSKRQRLSTGSVESPSTLRESPKIAEKLEPPAKGNGKNNLQEERKRGQRLFGGLLSTLSQSSTGTHLKRRQDIEKRQQEKAQQQKLEDESRRQEKLRILKELRAKDMVSFEEESMRLRHSNMLAMAQFLQTKTEPKIFYKPWELRSEDSSRIKRQIGETELIIASELAELASRKAARNPEIKPNAPDQVDPQTDEKVDEDKSQSTSKGEKEASPLPDSVAADSTTNDVVDGSSADVQRTSSKDNSNESEVMVVAAEDTVIY